MPTWTEARRKKQAATMKRKRKERLRLLNSGETKEMSDKEMPDKEMPDLERQAKDTLEFHPIVAEGPSLGSISVAQYARNCLVRLSQALGDLGASPEEQLRLENMVYRIIVGHL